MYDISAQNVSVFGSLVTPFFSFSFLSSRIRHLVLLILHHCFKKAALTGVTSFKAYASDVLGRRFEKV
jgi:flagellar biosynthesis protein FliR